MITLRPYQGNMVRDIAAGMNEKIKNQLVVLSTGGGKTVIFGFVSHNAHKKGKRVIILSHRREIADQIRKTLFGFGVTTGYIASGAPMTRDLIQVAMVGTIVRRLNYIPKPDMIITDECHHVVSPTYIRILQQWPDAWHLGFTATPLRLDGTGLGDIYDRMILGPSTADLIREKFLCYPVFKKPPAHLVQNYHVTKGDYDAGEQMQFVGQKKIIGDMIAEYRRHLDGQPTICACVNIEHALMVADAFTAAGYRARAVYGDMPKTERDDALQGLASGKWQVITFCDLIGEGIDIPVVTGLMLLRKTKSLGLFLQWCGRIMRIHEGKTHGVVLDLAGNYYLHGLPIINRNWELYKGKRKQKEKEYAITECPACFFVAPGKVSKCPSCGYEIKVIPPRIFKAPTVIAGELEDALPDGVSGSDIAEMAAFLANVQRLDPQARQRAMWKKTYEMVSAGIPDGKERLEAMSRSLGYKRGWTHFAWERVKNKVGA